MLVVMGWLTRYDGAALAPDKQTPETGETDRSKRPRLLRSIRTFDSLVVPAHRNYFGAMFVYFAAMQMTVLVRPWVAFDLSANDLGERSALVLGLTVAANNLPSLVLSPYAGALADRMSKRTILQACAVIMAVLAGVTAVGLASSWFAWWHVTIIGVGQGAVMTFITPTRRAIIGDLVGREHLLNATALHTMSMNVTRTVMPAAGGFIIVVAGAEWAYLSIAAMYVAGVSLLFIVPKIVPSEAARKRGMSGAVREGFQYAAKDRTIRSLMLIALMSTLFGQPLQHLLPLFADVLDITVDRVGLLFTFFGAGSLIGSTTAASLGNFKRKGLLLVSFLTLWGAAMMAFAFSDVYVLSLFLLIPVGMGHSGRNTVNIATLQTYTDPDMRGRVMALNAMMSGFMPPAVLLITAIAEFANAQVALGGVGAIILVYGLWQLLFARTVRNLE
ncbi:MAG: MFS transporter [Chloroflexi bacterium]|nr:MFS transporter [Chloroflexota bacterium]